jgi:hypothetical protein
MKSQVARGVQASGPNYFAVRNVPWNVQDLTGIRGRKSRDFKIDLVSPEQQNHTEFLPCN